MISHVARIVLASLIGVGAVLPLSYARDIAFRTASYNAELKDEKVPVFLERFLSEQGLAAVLSPQVQGIEATLNGPRVGSTRAVFESIMRAYQLTYFYDGSAVHVYRSNERDARDFSLPSESVERFIRAAADLRLANSRDPYNSFVASPATGLISISGTPRYIERMEVVLSNVQAQTPVTPLTMKYFPLKYAVAGDTYMNIGNREVLIPGVATVLAQVMGSRTPITVGARSTRPARNRLTNSSLGANDPTLAQNEDRFLREDYRSNAPSSTVVSGANSQSQVVADTARNAIIVRDVKDRMSMYAELIRELDVEASVVEIEATIIDIDTTKAKRVGFNWRWQNAGSELQFGSRGNENGFSSFKPDALRALNGGGANDGTGLPATTGPNINGLPQLPGFGAGSILGLDDQFKFVSRINALAEDGVTRIVSRPQVATLNDVEAAIESTQTVYVPVNGTYAVDLFDVAAGTLLRVTPHIINETDKRRIRLSVNIEDGNVGTLASGAAQVASFSLTNQNKINTQVVIDEGQSLLLGGLIREEASRGQNAVPGLGKIPVIGGLFRDRVDQSKRVERLFLLTPRLQRRNEITTQSTPSALEYEVNAPFDPPKEKAQPESDTKE
jgi:type III secretion protein C